MLNKLFSLFSKKENEKVKLPIVHSVAVYKRDTGGMFLFNPLAKHPTGGSAATNKTIILDEEINPETIGTTLRQALVLSESEPSWSESIKGDLWKDGQVKNMNQFVKKFSCVGVTFWVEKGIYEISPNKKYKSSGYISEKNDPIFEIGINSNEIELGRTLLQAFNHCK